MSKVKKEQKTAGTVIVLVLLALAVRVIYSLTRGDGMYLGDEKDYHHLAVNLLQGHGFSLLTDGTYRATAFKFPGLPAVMSVIYWLSGSHLLAVRLFQSLLGAATVPIAYLITLRLGYTRNIGLLAAAGVALYPYYIFSAGAVYPVVLTTFLVALTTLFLLYGRTRQDYRMEALGGLFFGISVLTFGHVLLALPLLMLWVRMNKQVSVRRAWTAGLLLAIVFVCVVTPWIVRNKIVMNRLGLSTGMEMNIYMGNAPGVTWTSGSGIMNLVEPEVAKATAGMSETESSKYYWAMAMKHIKSDPAHFVILSLGKALNFWRFYPNLGTRPITLKEKIVGSVTYGPALVLGLLYFILDKPRRRVNALLLAYPVATMIPIAITCSQDRYRMPYDIYLIILASAAIITWFKHNSHKSSSETSM